MEPNINNNCNNMYCEIKLKILKVNIGVKKKARFKSKLISKRINKLYYLSFL